MTPDRFEVDHAQVQHYCQAFYDWLDALRARVAEGPRPGYSEVSDGDLVRFRRILTLETDLRLSIIKSSYLGRRVYGGEQHRTRRCPQHDGHWSGISFGAGCPHGCGMTGWLPDPSEDAT